MNGLVDKRPWGTSHIELVGKRTGKSKQLPFVEDRLEYHHVKQMRAVHIRVVMDQCVALLQRFGRMLFQQRLECLGHDAQMDWDKGSLCQHITLCGI